MNRMEFGRVPNVDRVDFTLPPDGAGNGPYLESLRQQGTNTAPRVLVGTAGWTDRGYLGTLYPKETKSRDYLHQYARAFPTNELNSTYYGYDALRMSAWAASVPEGFLFCPKLPSTISHEREFENAHEEMDAFVAALQCFGDHLGRAWTILPPGFGPHRAKVLVSFLERYAPQLDLGVELRHQRWFADQEALDDMMAVFTQLGVTPMLTDVAGRRDVLHMRLCAPDTMVRFVGNSGHSTDTQRLDDWIERLGQWMESGLQRAYFFFHQKRDHETVELAQHMLPRLAVRTGLEFDPLEAPVRPKGELHQAELF